MKRITLTFWCFLFIGNSFFPSFTGTGIVLCTLSAHRQTGTMPYSSVCSNIHQSFDIHLDFRTQFSFNFKVTTDNVPDVVLFVISPVLYFFIYIYSGFCQDLLQPLTFQCQRCRSKRLLLFCFLVNQYLQYEP